MHSCGPHARLSSTIARRAGDFGGLGGFGGFGERGGKLAQAARMEPSRVFLLSPADCGGRRAALLFGEAAELELARRVRGPGGAPLGEVFSFLSGLYFRGKIAYARRFARGAARLPGALVITSGRGLLSPETPVRLDELAHLAAVPVDPAEPRYREPLLADAARLVGLAPPETEFVLLGSIATPKYVEVLLPVLGPRLWFPAPFVGVGDMTRGALLLRAASSGEELPYVQAAGAVRRRPRSRVERG